jgi:hypothetical protein
MKRLL